MQRKAVIDIDNTLWHFCDALHKELKKINSSMPSPDQWVEWDFWTNYFSEDEFMEAIHRIQLNQDNDSHLPYSEAQNFLCTLKDNSFHLVIASHRKPESQVQTEKWLKRHDLVFDDLHLSFDKTVLFDETCHLVVDDSPYTLQKAAEQGIFATGLIFPWNRGHWNNGYKLFDNLNKVLRHVLDNFHSPA
jgi:hypothetical protein